MNTNVTHKTRGEVISQVASYFDIIDNCIKEGDTNKRYTYAQNSNYGGSNVQNNSYATFILSPSCDNTSDLRNGFICTNWHGTVRSDTTFTAYDSKTQSEYAPEYTWQGWEDSFLINEKYELVHNGETIYTQNNAIEEGYITNCGIDEKTKRKDFYSKALHKMVWKEYVGPRCGVTIDWSVVKDNHINVIIPLKIDIRRYLPLSNVKYLPAMIGKFELRALFGTSGMVYYPVDPKSVWYNNYKRLSVLDIPDVTNEPTQIGDPITAITTCTYDATTKLITTMETAKVIIDVDNNYEWKQSQIVLPNFGISDVVYRSLEQRYSQIPLTFPTSTMFVTDMDSVLNGSSNSASYTYTPRFVDSIFILFPLKPQHRSVYKNPGFDNFEIKAGGYGTIPNTSISFNDDPRLLEYTQQALNLNEDGEGFSMEVLQSLVNCMQYDGAKITHDSSEPGVGKDSHDCCHFLCGFKLQPLDCFQQGHTTNSPIDYTVNIKQNSNSYYSTNVKAKPRICFLLDRTLSFQLRPDGGPPIAALDASDITTPVD